MRNAIATPVKFKIKTVLIAAVALIASAAIYDGVRQSTKWNASKASSENSAIVQSAHQSEAQVSSRSL